ncbi:Uncharacterised protein [Roseburia intestinalis]|uniref:HTH cro/C1-type domain-containing protein n=1 Tax=Roseburia intestinalis TaxID=166486 RepID=A0A6N3HHG9_9FIRM
MIVYDRLWITLKKKNISQYALIKDYGIDKAQLQRLRKNGLSTLFQTNFFRLFFRYCTGV